LAQPVEGGVLVKHAPHIQTIDGRTAAMPADRVSVGTMRELRSVSQLQELAVECVD